MKKKLRFNLKDIVTCAKKKISDYIKPQLLYSYKRFEIDTEFLKIDPSLWIADRNYKKGLKMLKG